MTADQHGNVMTASEESTSQYDDAVDKLLHFRPSTANAAEDAATSDPSAPMPQVLLAYLGLLATEYADAAKARESFAQYLASAEPGIWEPRERAHASAAEKWLSGDWEAASAILLRLSRDYPRDALALAVGHQLDFFLGDATTLRDRIGGALGAWNMDDPHFAPLHGMYAFGLEECGNYGRAEQIGLEAVQRDPWDVWGIHAVVHTYEMQASFETGRDFLDKRRDEWTTGNYLNVHNYWHYALFALESDDVESGTQIYDSVLHHADSAGYSMEMLDASGYLWRLLLEGKDESQRWQLLADSWVPAVAEPYYAFNDLFAVMAYVGAGRIADAERLIAERERWLAEAPDYVTNRRMTREIGIPVCRAVVSFGRQDYQRVVEELAPLRYRFGEFGGSHAQRDALQQTLVEAAMRAGDEPLARSLVSERIWSKPASPWNQRHAGRLLIAQPS